jgi:NAD-dependent deacetylase
MEIAKLEPLVVLTGAGISAESGVPTFRGTEGLWRTYRAEELATPIAFHRDPHLVWEFYAWRRELIAACIPNQAHMFLTEIEKQISDFTLITQNVDGLHAAAGSRTIIKLHGSIWRMRCTSCGNRWDDRNVPLAKSPPLCPRCGEIARPDVVWFGETLDADILDRAFEKAQRAHVILVIGTSGIVYPAAELPRVGKMNGAKLFEINTEATPISSIADQVYRSKATIGIQDWWADQQNK